MAGPRQCGAGEAFFHVPFKDAQCLVIRFRGVMSEEYVPDSCRFGNLQIVFP